MPSRFDVFMPLEIGFERRVQLAAEIVDGVTLLPVRGGIVVTAPGMLRRPVRNASGFYVWLEEAGRQAEEIRVDASRTPYQDGRADPVLPPDHSRIELAPRAGYPFPQGATALRGTIRASGFGPPEAVADATVRLQWARDLDWVDSPLASTSDASGGFAAVLRLDAMAEPRPIAGGIAVRLRVTRGGVTRTSAERPLRQGAVSTETTPFIWDELHS